MGLLFSEKLINGTLLLIMRAVTIVVAPLEQGLIKGIEVCNGRDGHKEFSTGVTHFVFDCAFFVSTGRVAKICQKTVMEHETIEAFSEFPLATFQDLGNRRRHVIRLYSNR